MTNNVPGAPEGAPPERGPRFPRPRRRRDRRGPHVPGAAPGAPGQSEPAAGAADQGPRQDRRPRAPREGGDRGRGGQDRGGQDRGAQDRGGRDRDRRDRGPREGKKGFGKKPGFGRDRDGPRQREAPKLYSFESVVDRGFEEVPDPANEGATKRVDWRIVKRTVADQKSAKPVSAVYLLRRESGDQDFANLAAARAAVNKTIVHPEKLTRAKADYPTTKK